MSVRRRLAVIGVALGITATAGALYLKPEALNRSEPLIPARYGVINGPYSVKYDFISPSLGWALVISYGRSTSQLYIFRTSDGAEHWQEQYSGDQGGLYLHFFDAKNGFLYGGDVLRTVDGGDHWQTVDAPGPSSQVVFANPLEGWDQVFDPDGVHMYRTTNGGLTWQRAGADPPQNAVIDPFPTMYRAFRGGGEGWLTAQGQPEAVVFVTHDGGFSWDTRVLIELYCCGPGVQDEIYDTSVLLVGTQGVVVFIRDERFGTVMAELSLDGGLSWSSADFPIDGVAIDEVTFVDANHWWVFHSESVYVTEDTGRSWEYVHDFGFPGSWNTVGAGAIDATHAWKTLTSTADSQMGALALTADGGVHWRLVNAPQP